jgi:hypothetical protein
VPLPWYGAISKDPPSINELEDLLRMRDGRRRNSHRVSGLDPTGVDNGEGGRIRRGAHTIVLQLTA